MDTGYSSVRVNRLQREAGYSQLAELFLFTLPKGIHEWCFVIGTTSL
jgi:hypothetical protein